VRAREAANLVTRSPREIETNHAGNEPWAIAALKPVVPAFDLALRSHPGTNRPTNQDAHGFLDDAERVVFVVADGVGGYDGGEEASQLAVQITLSYFRESPAGWSTEKRLGRAVQEANIAIHDRALIVPELRQMRTTITAVAVEGYQLFAAHVGDCRLYLARDGALVQLTKDHTVAAERALRGLIRGTDEEARSTLTRCLGNDLIVAIDRISRTVQGGDVLLLCSDGLHRVLDDPELRALVEAKGATEACDALIETANAKGTPDNLTAAVLRVPPGIAPPEPLSLWARMARMLGR
jgi:protein phosphatase